MLRTHQKRAVQWRPDYRTSGRSKQCSPMPCSRRLPIRAARIIGYYRCDDYIPSDWRYCANWLTCADVPIPVSTRRIASDVAPDIKSSVLLPRQDSIESRILAQHFLQGFPAIDEKTGPRKTAMQVD